MKAKHSSRLRNGQQGIALIEALIGILIFAFGVIGLVGLQVAMTRAQGTAKFRADANYLSSQVMGNIWADRANLAQYDTSGACDSYQPCMDWKSKVAATLPGGAAQIATTPATGVVSITVTWSTPAEGTHTYVVATSIR
ncbi:type IV pilus modification PilV family protein [Ramlibacter sp. AN1133]|uniref:type IV pilus modification PilV family protein n=1 Tax=Ramlibacter sp. AN1133 TaxID=3133429 RepID=UPI0030C06BED